MAKETQLCTAYGQNGAAFIAVGVLTILGQMIYAIASDANDLSMAIERERRTADRNSLKARRAKMEAKLTQDSQKFIDSMTCDRASFLGSHGMDYSMVVAKSCQQLQARADGTDAENHPSFNALCCALFFHFEARLWTRHVAMPSAVTSKAELECGATMATVRFDCLDRCLPLLFSLAGGL